MKRTAAPFALLFAACAAGGVPRDWRDIPTPPLRAFAPEQPRRIALPNGMVVFLQEDHELPFIQGVARIRGGSLDEPPDRTGLVALYGQVWRTGGTRSRTGDTLDDFLEARAAKVETFGDHDSTAVTWSCLKLDFEDVFTVFLELLREPAFREDKLLLAKTQMNTAIARRNDNPGEIASREATKLAYGPDSPFARVPEHATVAAVTRDDLVAWHAAHVHPNRMILGIVGDFDGVAMEARVRRAFEGWPAGPPAEKKAIPIREPAPGVYLVNRENVNQSLIRMVHLGTRKDSPDYHAIQVLNEILSGGFSSRLFSNLRTKRGLAYSVGGGVGTGWEHPGIVRLAIGTKSRTTAEAIEGLLAEIDDARRQPPTAEELALAKQSLLNSFVFRHDARVKVLRARMTFEFYGYPADFLERYRRGIERVTAEDVLRVARAYLHKERLRILVVGKAADFGRPLSAFGPVRPVDITIPKPPG